MATSYEISIKPSAGQPTPATAGAAGQDFANLQNRHPCFGKTARLARGRVHLPVSPSCNISCNYCRREFNKDTIRPGVAGRIVAAHEAAGLVARALEICPSLSVVGIAGPGDPLATPAALTAFREVGERFPDLAKCLSTNGLLLASKLPQLLEVGVESLTVTVNGVDPAIVSRIVERIVWNCRILRGNEAAAVLIGRQLAGIRAAAAAGILVKVNLVLIPGVNDGHVAATARAVKLAGARLFNIIPLIPQHRFSASAPPDCTMVDKARRDAEAVLPVFSHCQRCRADACGIPGGQDLSSQLYGDGNIAETFSHG